ncbi:hypothetical protein LCGC14_2244640 [marine sediment metagenome]|uniref:Uncharacterized protein n=1 Tax=marine sediment metagenome TaxID=412755 RepID=A0A0F9D454_9ZZZZ
MNITTTQFDAILLDLAQKDGADTLLAIPGVYELVAEEYNNAVIETFEAYPERYEHLD